jgi:hypothetical protein
MRTPRETPVVLSDLYEVFASSVRVVVKDSPISDARTLFESTDKRDLDDLQRSLLLETPTESFHCMCFGSPVLYLERHESELVELTNHHGVSVRCSLWASSNVRILDTEKWLSWFDHRGMPGPRREVEETRAREEVGKADWDRWLAAMPEPIAPLWPKEVFNQFVHVQVEPLCAALEQGLPNERARILVLLEWFGSGAGPWDGFPYYETAAEKLLLGYPTSSIVEAVQSSTTTPRQTEGAARLFAGGSFRKQRPGSLDEVPDVLKRFLWNHVKGTADPDKLSRAAHTFTQ